MAKSLDWRDSPGRSKRRLDLGKVEVKREYLPIRFRFDHVEEPELRFALVYWRDVPAAPLRDGFRGWLIYKMGNYRSERELLTIGLLLFGPSPWRRAGIVSAFGVLGTLEKLVASLVEPGEAFAFSFDLKDDDGRPLVVRRELPSAPSFGVPSAGKPQGTLF